MRRFEVYWALDGLDRQTLRHRRRIRGFATRMGGGAHTRLVGLVPKFIK